ECGPRPGGEGLGDQPPELDDVGQALLDLAGQVPGPRLRGRGHDGALDDSLAGDGPSGLWLPGPRLVDCTVVSHRLDARLVRASHDSSQMPAPRPAWMDTIPIWRPVRYMVM